ncbi:hypothetical protein [Nocardioides marmoraquaticus]
MTEAAHHPTGDGGVPAWAAPLREEVRQTLADAGWRRQLSLRCFVGHPGAARETGVAEVAVPSDRVVAALTPGAAAGLRAGLVERALDGLDDPRGALCWVARSGPLQVGDPELAWWAAAWRGFARHDLRPEAFCVLNRTGWLEPDTGRGRTWYRLRPARVAAGRS